MEELQVFMKRGLGEVRILNDKETGKVLFCGKDVATALGYANTKDAIRRHCRWGVKRALPHPQSEDKSLSMTFIPEGDVYRLITHSKLPSAQRFESWVFDEVLPGIRRDGYYINRQEMKMELMEDLLSGYKELQPNKARYIHEDLIKALKDQNTVLRGENEQLKRNLRSAEARNTENQKIIEDVKNQLLKKLLAGKEI